MKYFLQYLKLHALRLVNMIELVYKLKIEKEIDHGNCTYNGI